MRSSATDSLHPLVARQSKKHAKPANVYSTDRRPPSAPAVMHGQY